MAITTASGTDLHPKGRSAAEDGEAVAGIRTDCRLIAPPEGRGAALSGMGLA
jgi:hypothetical protein